VKNKISESFQSAKRSETENKKFFSHLKKRHPKDLDIVVKKIHEEAFQHIDCLECANCCKSISPIITDKDIERISRSQKMRPAVFTEKYLQLDKDNDYVFNLTPCPFLDEDNYCKIYDVRPKACSEYPHTSQPGFVKRFDLTINNSFYCHAILEIIGRLKKEY
jgi:Fe-S-cluster containining protein